ncbi:MAG: GNAT family N-acetyltransferase [Candidatus Kapabacteria bacterium]|nr:GNAT family N-acetyltransferase [Ignavibacteria bacterium]MBP6509199.1 GNAT family N-acetyltransferase [Candidatus Kapabacteria bacterium]MBK6419989.1 GNAT family N-acetyltransferase [Ignavibacteria bacterium]MBK6759378.1 GNAT family N-acetyltransferase [Ignavibacteria bacterium]MBK7413072.1 GNAT family N-acetyltransferase [Ignavibacteria bacterium]
MSMLVRDATPDDVHAIAEIHVASWQSTYKGIVPQEFLDTMSVDDSAARWMRSFSRTTCKLIVAEIDDVIVGWCYSGYCRDDDAHPTTAELWAIYIHPNAIQRGVGQALWKNAKESLASIGYTHVIVWVLKENLQAIGFYSRIGLQPDGVEKTIVIHDAELQELRMTAEIIG